MIAVIKQPNGGYAVFDRARSRFCEAPMPPDGTPGPLINCTASAVMQYFLKSRIEREIEITTSRVFRILKAVDEQDDAEIIEDGGITWDGAKGQLLAKVKQVDDPEAREVFKKEVTSWLMVCEAETVDPEEAKRRIAESQKVQPLSSELEGAP